MKIGLINANFKSEGPEKLVGLMPPFQLLCLAGPLIDTGFTDITLIDAAQKNLTIDEIVKNIIEQKFEIIFVSAMASTAATPSILAIIKRVKEIDPTIYTVMGGVHSTYMYNEIMSNDYIDFIGRNEGELLGVALVSTLEENGDLNKVKGLVWRRDGEIVVNEMQEPIELDRFRVAWELVENWSGYVTPITGERATVVQFSRGCPFRCTFCGQWKFWNKWRHRNIKYFVDDIEMLKRKYDVTYFFFADENPQTVPELWYNLLNEIKMRKLDIHMIMNLRVTDVIRDEKYFKLYKDAGVVTIDLGLESAIQKRLKEINKKTTVDENALAIKILREAGILSIVQTLVGFPDESQDTLKLTFERLKAWTPDLLHFYYVTPFPWSDIGINITPEMIIEKDYSKWDYRNPILKLNYLSPSELKKAIKKFTFEYNFNTDNFYRILNNPDSYLRDTLVNALFSVLTYRSKHTQNRIMVDTV